MKDSLQFKQLPSYEMYQLMQYFIIPYYMYEECMKSNENSIIKFTIKYT